jgi:membrane protease YdiL (CAAX protease family)
MHVGVLRLAALARSTPFWLGAALAALPASFGLLLLSRAGIIGMAVPHPTIWRLLLLLVAAPVLEELVFRGLIQEWLAAAAARHCLPAIGRMTAANLLTSLAFAACHLPYQTPELACLIVVPSLVFGRLKELHVSLVPAMLMHAWYNAALLVAAGYDR